LNLNLSGCIIITVIGMTNELREKKFIKMTTEPVNKLVPEMAVPAIISMLVTALYNTADTFFIGKISTQATGAIGIVFTYMALIQAVAFFFGQGSGNYISRSLGMKNEKKASEMAAYGFFTCFFVGTFIAIILFLLMDKALVLFGATETILPEARAYFKYILAATPFIMTTFVMNNHMRFQGNAGKAMFGVMTGAVLNVALDPVLIFGFEMGISGAALATAFSQVVGFFIMLYLTGKSGGIKIKIKEYKFSAFYFKEVVAGGLPSLGRQGIMSISAICLNRAAGLYGDSAIAAFSVVSRISMIASSIVIGIGQGFQPVCGFNFGAGKFDRVREAVKYSLFTSTLVLVVFSVIGFLFAEQIVRLFRADDMELVKTAVFALRAQSLTLPLFATVVVANMYLQNIRKTVAATVVAVARQGIFLIGALYILQPLAQLRGVQLSQPVADVAAFLLALPMLIYYMKKLKN